MAYFSSDQAKNCILNFSLFNLFELLNFQKGQLIEIMCKAHGAVQ